MRSAKFNQTAVLLSALSQRPGGIWPRVVCACVVVGVPIWIQSGYKLCVSAMVSVCAVCVRSGVERDFFIDAIGNALSVSQYIGQP